MLWGLQTVFPMIGDRESQGARGLVCAAVSVHRRSAVFDRRVHGDAQELPPVVQGEAARLRVGPDERHEQAPAAGADAAQEGRDCAEGAQGLIVLL